VRYESIECAGRHTCKCCCGHYRRSNETNPMNSFTSFHTSGAGVHVSIHCSSPDCRDLALSCIIASRSGARREVPGDKGGDTVPAASARESADMSNDECSDGEVVAEAADQLASLNVAVEDGAGTDTSGEAEVAVGDGDPELWKAHPPTNMSKDKSSDDELVSEAADQFAALLKVAVDEDGAGTGTDTSGEAKVAVGDPELWKAHPPTEDCPVCLVPLPLSKIDIVYYACCSRALCFACVKEHHRAVQVTNGKRAEKELPPLGMTCAFCRIPVPEEDAENIEVLEKKNRKDDAEAICCLASYYIDGVHGLPKDERRAVTLFFRAAGLGSVNAHSVLGERFAFDSRFDERNDFFFQDRNLGRNYLEIAAKGGDAGSRHNLGVLEYRRGSLSLAIKHFQLAAAAGFVDSMKELWKTFYRGRLSKFDLENTLRAHQAVCDEMSSEDRERHHAAQDAFAGDDELLKQFYESYYNGDINAKELKKLLKVHQKKKRKAHCPSSIMSYQQYAYL